MKKRFFCEINVSFVVKTLDDDPVIINELLGLAADEILQKNGMNACSMKIYANTWKLNSRLSKDMPIEAHLSELLDRLMPYKNNFKKPDKYTYYLSLGIYYKETNPGFHLDSNLLKKISELGIGLDFDMYFLQ